jgi:hypothetical protein
MQPRMSTAGAGKSGGSMYKAAAACNTTAAGMPRCCRYACCLLQVQQQKETRSRPPLNYLMAMHAPCNAPWCTSGGLYVPGWTR